MSEDDRRAFREAMNGVRPLRAPEPVAGAPRPRPRARFTRADELEVLHESLLPPAEPGLLESADALAFRRPWIREDVLRRLKRGQFAVAGELDLHGLVRHQAHDVLRGFIHGAADRGLGCVRVIHGKGRGSGPGGPVLKRVVDHWLRRMDDVAAFCSARPVDGGTGAVYVLLSAPRRRTVPRDASPP